MVTKKDFSSWTHCLWERNLSSDVYKYFTRLCEKTGKKPKIERYILGKLTEFLSVFKIFVKNGKDLGRGRALFYNENRVSLEFAIDEYLRFGKEWCTTTDENEETEVIRRLSEHFRRNRGVRNTGGGPTWRTSGYRLSITACSQALLFGIAVRTTFRVTDEIVGDRRISHRNMNGLYVVDMCHNWMTWKIRKDEGASESWTI